MKRNMSSIYASTTRASNLYQEFKYLLTITKKSFMISHWRLLLCNSIGQAFLMGCQHFLIRSTYKYVNKIQKLLTVVIICTSTKVPIYSKIWQQFWKKKITVKIKIIHFHFTSSGIIFALRRTKKNVKKNF